jgi:ubiquinone/menaquinone biosynthesis C-methylase UbiE
MIAADIAGLHRQRKKVGLDERSSHPFPRLIQSSIAAMTEPDVALVKEVFEQWAMYDAVVRNGYMHHAELAGALGDWAKMFGQPLRIVDLGSSDSWLATHSFRDAEVESYLGVDLAESSIERARGNVAIWSGRTELICGNLANVLAAQPDGSANLALASYSLHHFSTDDKLKLIREVWRLLEPGGAFLWIDAVRHDGESRGAYIDRLTESMSTDWTGLTVEQRERGVTHVRTSDFPETKSWMLEHVEAAGFAPGGTLLQEKFFDGWVFLKP